MADLTKWLQDIHHYASQLAIRIIPLNFWMAMTYLQCSFIVTD
jgi:hypothetical protein